MLIQTTEHEVFLIVEELLQEQQVDKQQLSEILHVFFMSMLINDEVVITPDGFIAFLKTHELFLADLKLRIEKSRTKTQSQFAYFLCCCATQTLTDIQLHWALATLKASYQLAQLKHHYEIQQLCLKVRLYLSKKEKQYQWFWHESLIQQYDYDDHALARFTDALSALLDKIAASLNDLNANNLDVHYQQNQVNQIFRLHSAFEKSTFLIEKSKRQSRAKSSIVRAFSLSCFRVTLILNN